MLYLLSHLVTAAEQLCEVVQGVWRQLKGVPQAQQHRQHLLQARVPLHALCTAGSAFMDPHTALDSAAALQMSHMGSARACKRGLAKQTDQVRYTLKPPSLLAEPSGCCDQIAYSSSPRAGRCHRLTLLVLVFLSLLLYDLDIASQASVLDMRLVGPLRRDRALSLGLCSLVLAVARDKIGVCAGGPRHIVIAQDYGNS